MMKQNPENSEISSFFFFSSSPFLAFFAGIFLSPFFVYQCNTIPAHTYVRTYVNSLIRTDVCPSVCLSVCLSKPDIDQAKEGGGKSTQRLFFAIVRSAGYFLFVFRLSVFSPLLLHARPYTGLVMALNSRD